jgi:hypothetical protein
MLTEAEALFSGLNIAQICAEFRAKDFKPEDCQDDKSRADIKVVRADGSVVLIEAKRAWSYELLGQCVAHVQSESECEVVALVTHDLPNCAPSQMGMPGRWVQLRVLKSLWAMGVKTYSVGRGMLEVVTAENVDDFTAKEYIPGGKVATRHLLYRKPIGPKPPPRADVVREKAERAARVSKRESMIFLVAASFLQRQMGYFTTHHMAVVASAMGVSTSTYHAKSHRRKMSEIGWAERSSDTEPGLDGKYCRWVLTEFGLAIASSDSHGIIIRVDECNLALERDMQSECEREASRDAERAAGLDMIASYIQRSGPSTVKDMACGMGKAECWISHRVDSLVRSGVLSISQRRMSGLRGKPPKVYALNPSQRIDAWTV